MKEWKLFNGNLCYFPARNEFYFYGSVKSNDWCKSMTATEISSMVEEELKKLEEIKKELEPYL